ncbi:MAG: hypothetical protein ABI699_00590 [Caldimonas sp.]
MNDTPGPAAAAAPLDWNKLDALTDPQFAALVDAAIFVLEGGGEGGGPVAVGQMPASVLTQALAASFDERGFDGKAAERIVRQPQLSRPVATLLLQQLAGEPAIAAAIEQAWRQRGGMLFVGTASILAAALLLLVVKLKKFKADKTGVTVEFDKLSNGALGAVFKFIGA